MESYFITFSNECDDAEDEDEDIEAVKNRAWYLKNNSEFERS